jgi:2-dehydro-3-deoxyphosphooctonate aldolase (KDO 8-P synthase)
MKPSIDQIPKINYADEKAFFLIAGPCAIEGRDMAFHIAEKLVELSNRYKFPLIFKGSYRKANRSRLDSFHGIGDEKALSILKEVGNFFSIPCLTDIHTNEEAALASKYVDILQIPAFLCRQTSLLLAAGQTGCWVNVKKGQFMSPESMKFVIDKVKSTSNEQLMLTERGTSFGYGDLIVDFRGFPTMNEMDALTVMDCTHSLQQPNQPEGVTGGRPELIMTMAKVGLAAGANGLFIETHHDPASAKSDGKNMLSLDKMELLIDKCLSLYKCLNT